MNWVQAQQLATLYRGQLKSRRKRSAILAVILYVLALVGALAGALDVWYGLLTCTALAMFGVWAMGDAIDSHHLLKRVPE